jgi:hypothetical protein
MAEDIRYPNITVRLSEGDGNAFAILGKMFNVLKMNNVPQVEIDQFRAEATAGNYDHLLQTCMRWVNVE